MFGFGADKRIEPQRQKLADLEVRLGATERAAANLPQLRQQFAHVWFESAERDKALQRMTNARELLDLSRKIVVANSYREAVDENIELLDKFVPSITVDIDAFIAILIGRQHLWKAQGGEGQSTFDPTVRDSQQALYESGRSLADAVQQHIDELRPIRETHQGPWPDRLDLDNLQRHVDDARQALGIYQERFQSHDEALPPDSSVTLLMIAQNMEGMLDLIEHERPNLAVDSLMRSILKNSGSS